MLCKSWLINVRQSQEGQLLTLNYFSFIVIEKSNAFSQVPAIFIFYSTVYIINFNVSSLYILFSTSCEIANQKFEQFVCLL